MPLLPSASALALADADARCEPQRGAGGGGCGSGGGGGGGSSGAAAGSLRTWTSRACRLITTSLTVSNRQGVGSSAVPAAAASIASLADADADAVANADEPLTVDVQAKPSSTASPVMGAAPSRGPLTDAISRDPTFLTKVLVDATPASRFDVVCLHQVAIQVRLRVAGAVLGADNDPNVALQPQCWWEIVASGHGSGGVDGGDDGLGMHSMMMISTR